MRTYVKSLLVGVCAAAVVAGAARFAAPTQAQTTSEPFHVRTLAEISLETPDHIRLLIAQTANWLVEIYVYSVRGSSRFDRNTQPQPLAGMAIDGWLLRSDGTAVAPQTKDTPQEKPVMVNGAKVMGFGFDMSLYEVSGFVVRVSGKYYGQAISVSSDASPLTTAWKYWVVSTPDIVGDFEGNATGFRPPVGVKVAMPRVGNQTDSSGECEALIDADGRTTFEHGIAAVHDMDTAAVRRAIDEWRFTPATLDGKPIRVRLRVEVANSSRR